MLKCSPNLLRVMPVMLRPLGDKEGRMKEEPLETRWWEGALQYSWQSPRPPPRVSRGWEGRGEGAWGSCSTRGEATSSGFVLRVVRLHWESLSQMHPIDAIPEQGRERRRGNSRGLSHDKMKRSCCGRLFRWQISQHVPVLVERGENLWCTRKENK